ncbi:unnamed protein product [Sphenostylis stenocarpa]|uniref:Uncharacterized protein n=1 Tax=Sphenostylis stenocarpa TaxID=92480 RepID=A0AA86SHD3_9FABA|nr:unnamed protein product [Sphenostylis stenocarpa]
MAWRHKAVVPGAKALGIISFDAGKTMCRLISLYHSLSDEEIAKLNREVIKSKGITYLNSQHECFLLNLAAAERLEELDTVADSVSRLGRKCFDRSLGSFDLVYADLKLGLIDLRKLGYGSRNSLKIISKMEKLVSSTRNLYMAMESMAVLENSEKKRQRLKTNDYNNWSKQNLDYLNEEIACCRKQVQHYKEVSLWNQTLDKTVGIMAKVVCIVYARICSVFGGYIANCSCYNINGDGDNENNNCCCLLEHRELYKKNYCLYEESLHKRVSRSGPIPKANSNKTGVIRFLNREFDRPTNGVNNRVLRLAPPSTVGGAGLAARYAEVVLLAEQWLHAPAIVGEDAREAFYGMLPERVRRKVAAKLKGRWRREEEEEALAEGWRDAVEELLEWLSPVAHDTVRWQAERSMETAKFEAKTTALLLQTLHYSDLEKAEAAIVEVLVGLSCIYWCERTRNKKNKRNYCWS